MFRKLADMAVHAPACLALAFAVATTFAAEKPVPPPIVKVGFAETDITPDIGMEQPGGYGKSFHRTFHDACKVRAVVFDDGKQRVALVGLDTLAVPRYTVLEARAEIAKRCGIKPEAVLVGASHSHSSGPVGMVQPGEYDHDGGSRLHAAIESADRRGGLPGGQGAHRGEGGRRRRA
jgi:neutral ceramidase